MIEDKGIPLPAGMGLEEWLKNHDDSRFPLYSGEKAERPYPERYEEYKKALGPVHDNVEKGAMAAGAKEWMEKSIKIIEDVKNDVERARMLDELTQSDPVVHLNNHGRGHVQKVIEKVSEMLHFFDRGHLTPYEGFFLLCAIQTHDVGNVFGREGHELQCKKILSDKGKPFIPDSFERKVIEKLALVHGGVCENDRDTIRHLSAPKKVLHDRNIRKRLLAALLRFGDELADDTTRADSEGLERGTILEGSRIYHQYSAALHTVKIERNEETGRVELVLSFELGSSLASKYFKKLGQDKLLLDEIYDRTLKMERERRYCMRYLRPSFSLDCIRVEVVIQNDLNAYESDTIRYTLEENGYPNDPVSGSIKQHEPGIRTGTEELEFMKKEWGIDI